MDVETSQKVADALSTRNKITRIFWYIVATCAIGGVILGGYAWTRLSPDLRRPLFEYAIMVSMAGTCFGILRLYNAVVANTRALYQNNTLMRSTTKLMETAASKIGDSGLAQQRGAALLKSATDKLAEVVNSMVELVKNT
jgi:hypothetical protein